MKKREWNEGLDNLDPDIVEKYVERKDMLRQKNKKPKGAWLRVGAVAACFLLVAGAIGAVITVMLSRDDGPRIEPYIPDGNAWSPIIDSDVGGIILSADKVGGVFDDKRDGVGTNQYTPVFAAAPEYLGISPLPVADYLPIYSAGDAAPTKDGLQSFINEYKDAATAFFGVNADGYEIKEIESWDGSVYYRAEIGVSGRCVNFIATDNLMYLNYYNLAEKRLKINGDMVFVSESDTDGQIKEKLADTIAYVCDSFGKDYSCVRISRFYLYKQLETIKVDLYPAEETIFPSFFSGSPMTSDYISLTLNTDWGSGTSYHWDGSKDKAYLTGVSLYKASENWNAYYTVDAKSRMLTLKEAEQLLLKGYVFGGHFCPLCMAEQPEVDFSDYTCVDIEYVSGENGKLCIPFYAFYKYIGETDHGIGIYAKTYVPAVEVSGYEEYFESQKGKHRGN